MSCVKNMDYIYYMENGQIIESGRHEELMNTDLLHSNLYI